VPYAHTTSREKIKANKPNPSCAAGSVEGMRSEMPNAFVSRVYLFASFVGYNVLP